MCNKCSAQCADPTSDAPSGPLLYHFENMANELSVELSYEDIRTAVVTTGFHMEVRQTRARASSSPELCAQKKTSVSVQGGERVSADHLHREPALHAEVRLRLCLLCGPEASRGGRPRPPRPAARCQVATATE